jgi:hypothetical protein
MAASGPTIVQGLLSLCEEALNKVVRIEARRDSHKLLA